MLGVSCTSAAATALSGGNAPPPPPPWALNTLVIEGDSITNTTPGGGSPDFYGNLFLQQNPAITGHNRAQGSRNVGYVAEGDALDDDGNSLLGNVAEDMAYQPDLITCKIGANDISNTRTAATYIAALIALRGHYAAARPQCRVAWSPPLPYNPSGGHPTYTQFTANRAALFAMNIRNPAVWGQWADYYLPLGEYPDFATDSALFADTVHPSGPATNAATGQGRLHAVYTAAIRSIAGTASVEDMWPDSETNLAPGTTYTRRFIVQGINPFGVTGGVSCTGASSTVSINGAAPSQDTTDRTAWLYNGDVIDLTFTTSASNNTPVTVNLTIAGQTRDITYTTVAAVDPVTVVTSGQSVNPNPSSLYTHSGLTFGTGYTLVGLCSRNSAQSDGVTIQGAPATLLHRSGRASTRQIEVWGAPTTAGTGSVVVDHAASQSHQVVAFVTLANADPVPIEVVNNAPANQSSPHSTPPFTVPANGMAVSFYYKEGGVSEPAVTGSGETTVLQDAFVEYQSGTNGIALGVQDAAGTGKVASFAYKFGTYGRAALVFKALGT